MRLRDLVGTCRKEAYSCFATKTTNTTLETDAEGNQVWDLETAETVAENCTRCAKLDFTGSLVRDDRNIAFLETWQICIGEGGVGNDVIPVEDCNKEFLDFTKAEGLRDEVRVADERRAKMD